MPASLAILSCESSARKGESFGKLAQFLGLSTEIIPVRPEMVSPPAALSSSDADRVLAVSREVLIQLRNQAWFVKLLAECRFILVYGFAATNGESAELKWLTEEVITSVAAVPPGVKHIKVHSDVTFDKFPVSGQAYSEADGPSAFFEVNSTIGKIETYISANDRPYFVSIPRSNGALFLLAEESVVDIDTVVGPESTLRGWYAQLIAAAMFLRISCVSQCWTAPVTPANFIVDDPYLRARYGFIRYESLLNDLQKSHSALTIAFIPFNYKRSHPKTVALLRHNHERFSIAVHGCDHTGGEFASLDQQWLDGTASCALERMEAHERLAAMPFDNVMVFPQGHFSTKAITALKKCGYAAAVNTSPRPVDEGDNRLTIRDFLSVAVTRYDSFPIFVRRYPRDVFEYAFDILFQKPVLGVEHHEYFRNGTGEFLGIVEKLAGLRAKIVWMPLGQAVETSCLIRKIGAGKYALRHFTPVLHFKNTSSETILFQIEKIEQDSEIEAVMANDKKIAFEIRTGFVCYSAELRPGEDLKATIIYSKPLRVGRKVPLKYGLSASFRRVLSDLRDNHLARHQGLLAFAKKAKAKLAGDKEC